MLWQALFCWRNGVGFDTVSLSLAFGVADLCVLLNSVGLVYVDHNMVNGYPPQQRERKMAGEDPSRSAVFEEEEEHQGEGVSKEKEHQEAGARK
ncbi:hypothetical protein NDU88_002588 [Pleurodeles waltl]|uniref:Uncharacterized protein n=1 Tax=Pleurodeles waltl TaxID=8319 RepID=A0AAV7VDQ6_PLEWA|nr:hypothetical protein NDU88_002588 [Pleurodeles waltl]